MHGHEVLRPQEEIDIPGAEAVLARVEVDAVQDQVEEIAVRLDLRMVTFTECVLDRELVEVKHVGQDLRFLRAWTIEVDPHPHAALRREPGGVHPIDDLGGPAFVFVDGDQSPTLAPSAACAAASRATGTRYGEQLT